MKLRLSNLATGKTNTRDAFPLAPPSSSVSLSQPGKLTNRSATREGLDLRDLAKDREVHAPCCQRSDGPSTNPTQIANGTGSGGAAVAVRLSVPGGRDGSRTYAIVGRNYPRAVRSHRSDRPGWSERLRPHRAEERRSEARCSRQFAPGAGPRRQCKKADPEPIPEWPMSLTPGTRLDRKSVV